ncbi:DUF6446 family protein [Thalassococcus sp. BH17M4-6]|uniref:DUF6446 family protein n=1 Tax=Thalassococcus sp. BH17M4-6 TaxID=3413148 RepID=UPI003BD6AD05
MTGRFLAILIVVSALLAGAGMYYLQVYAYYEPVVATGTDDVQLTPLQGDRPETILYEDFQAIDANSSPIRYRACFTTPSAPGVLADTYAPYPGAAPRVAPGWFDCFDAEAIGALLRSGQARAFLGERNLEYGIDRVVAVTEDGHGYVWHEVNDCGDKAYDGSPLDPTCPDRP